MDKCLLEGKLDMTSLLYRSLSNMSKKIFYPAADRNKSFILEVLQKHIDLRRPAKMLEISSGTGQHAAYFAAYFPRLTIQPSEVEVGMFNSIRAYAKELRNKNVKNPIRIDAQEGPWPVDCDYDYILNVNMFHVTPYACSIGFFKYGSKVLKQGGLIFTYGAYKINGIIEPQSNVDFDRHIKEGDPRCGLRELNDLKALALANGISFKKLYDLPASNKCCVWQKIGSDSLPKLRQAY